MKDNRLHPVLCYRVYDRFDRGVQGWGVIALVNLVMAAV